MIVHLGMATPNFGIQEYMGYDPLAARYAYESAYLPVARRLDGSMTDW
ncbi:hypothetical protein [Rhodococcus sp. 14-2483-1-1]|nr:hypothetical protein [Rhodococcus sp. 14-2483-1-1]